MKQGANQTIIESGYDNWKRNVASDGADVTRDGRLSQKLAPEAGKVERRGTANWLEEADGSLCRDGTSLTRVKFTEVWRQIRWWTAVHSWEGHRSRFRADGGDDAEQTMRADVERTGLHCQGNSPVAAAAAATQSIDT